MIMTLTVYSDPGHSWLEVPLEELSRVGLSIYHDFSSFSYVGVDKRGKVCAYLEEDCDMGIYLHRVLKRDGQRPNVRDKESKRNSPVRRFESCPYGERFQGNLAASIAFFKDRYATA